MSIIMKPFICIYHIVSAILDFPKKIFNKTTTKTLENVENQRLKSDIRKDTVIEKKEEIKEKKQDNDNFAGIRKPQKDVKKLISYRYVIVNTNNKKSTGTFDAESESDVKAFLESQDYKVLKIEVKKPYDIEIGGHGPIKAGSLAFSLTQLSTYVKAGIPLIDSVRILSKQSSKLNEKKAYERLVYDLLKGENLSDAMLKQNKTFPKLLINMIKTAEMTGDLPSVLDDMADYYTYIDQTKRQMISAMTYPAVVVCLAIGVLVFMLMYLVPQFVQLFKSEDATLPAITLFIINASSFLKHYYLHLIVGIIAFIFIFKILFNNVKAFRTAIQVFVMHIPIFGNIIIYNEVANFTKTFASLLNHGVFITDSMEVLSKITSNEVYKRIISNTLDNLGKGESISNSFKGEWAFPIVDYEMLVTGENTGQLGLMMEKVAEHFQNLHKNLVNQMKSLIEPLMIIILAVIVGIILLSIVIPMFDIYGKIK